MESPSQMVVKLFYDSVIPSMCVCVCVCINDVCIIYMCVYISYTYIIYVHICIYIYKILLSFFSCRKNGNGQDASGISLQPNDSSNLTL